MAYDTCPHKWNYQTWNHAKKDLKGKKVSLWFGNVKVRCKEFIYQISVRLMRAGDNLLFLIYSSTKGVTLQILSLSDCVPRWILIVQFVWTVVIVHGSLLYGLSALRRIPSCVNRTLLPTLFRGWFSQKLRPEIKSTYQRLKPTMQPEKMGWPYPCRWCWLPW